MIKTNTACCALAQLSGLNNNTSKDDILKELLELKEERDGQYIPTIEGGQTSYFVICTPGEHQLKQNLLSLGFKEVHQFERRNGYEPGLLSMLIINI